MAECDSPECVQALTRLQNARNAVLSLCSQLDQLRATAASFESLAKSMLLAAAGLAALASALLAFLAFPWNLIAAAALYAVALAFLIIALYFASKAAGILGKVTEAANQLAAARDTFSNAAAEVMATCPQECWGDLNQPPCP